MAEPFGLAHPVEYRRQDTDSTWHFCCHCPQWHEDSFNIIRLEKVAADLRLCEECVKREQTGECNGTNARSAQPAGPLSKRKR